MRQCLDNVSTMGASWRNSHVSTRPVKLSIASGVEEVKPSCFRTMAIDRWIPTLALAWCEGTSDWTAVASYSISGETSVGNLLSAASFRARPSLGRLEMWSSDSSEQMGRLRFDDILNNVWSISWQSEGQEARCVISVAKLLRSLF